MERLVIIYFSGTGNSKYLAERFYSILHYQQKEIYSIEDDANFSDVIYRAQDVMLIYPICGGNMPIIMREFLRKYSFYFADKNLITIVSQAGFSGDGGALAYRYLKESKVHYKGSYHITMPTNVSFGKIFKIKNGDELKSRMQKVDKKIESIAYDIVNNRCKKVGSSKLSYLIGYHLQRKYFERIEDQLKRKFTVDSAKCVRCGKCISQCPMHNITKHDGDIVGMDNCTLCYRCVHICPANAITIIRHEPIQYKGVNNAGR